MVMNELHPPQYRASDDRQDELLRILAWSTYTGVMLRMRARRRADPTESASPSNDRWTLADGDHSATGPGGMLVNVPTSTAPFE
jgi:hypothetical protein